MRHCCGTLAAVVLRAPATKPHPGVGSLSTKSSPATSARWWTLRSARRTGLSSTTPAARRLISPATVFRIICAICINSVFPKDTSIAPGEYKILYATTAEEQSENSANCTNFGLSKSGDFLFITDAYYGIVTQMEIPPLYTDVSYVRESDGTYGFCAVPSPGKENTGRILSDTGRGVCRTEPQGLEHQRSAPLGQRRAITAGSSSTTAERIRSVSKTFACRTTRATR